MNVYVFLLYTIVRNYKDFLNFIKHLLLTKAYYKDLYIKRYPERVWNTQKHLATPISLHPTQTPLKAPTAATAMGLTAAKTLLMHHQLRYFWNTNLLQRKSRISDFGKYSPT